MAEGPTDVGRYRAMSKEKSITPIQDASRHDRVLRNRRQGQASHMYVEVGDSWGNTPGLANLGVASTASMTLAHGFAMPSCTPDTRGAACMVYTVHSLGGTCLATVTKTSKAGHRHRHRRRHWRRHMTATLLQADGSGQDMHRVGTSTSCLADDGESGTVARPRPVQPSSEQRAASKAFHRPKGAVQDLMAMACSAKDVVGQPMRGMMRDRWTLIMAH